MERGTLGSGFSMNYTVVIAIVKVGQIISHCPGRNLSVLDRSEITSISLLNLYCSLHAVGE